VEEKAKVPVILSHELFSSYKYDIMILPAFSTAIFSMVSPNILTWSSCIDVIMDNVGVMIFVESSLPPSPTSTTIASQLARLKAANARVLVSSKNVAGIEFFSHRSKSSGNILCDKRRRLPLLFTPMHNSRSGGHCGNRMIRTHQRVPITTTVSSLMDSPLT
jgi:uncharacterized protein YqjF (DUF2071 family)